MRGLAINFASTHQTENPRGFSEVGENKQLLIAIVGNSFYSFLLFIFSIKSIITKTAFPVSQRILTEYIKTPTRIVFKANSLY
ncbi:hypothetical protein C7H61_00950 [Mesoflavibacter zeaxanthinifaciens subsp. sabulilitoris]|uniref:Uncharacterized protein n=1 Tax=Mesoflavibacter zeaxanthinifaciens subsp. sabulilitoris TaxID=1520893 RepID=A0A2T1NNI7_9FLAO|nr:hypothetical protein C7H61_00950 [Mesoflavibacter zeaxanthinifaciens subsp. sabulilitoris]